MPAAEVHRFAGIDVSGRELGVALRHGQGDHKPALAKFPNHSSGHKALVAYLLCGGGRVRVGLEASGNYSLDLALTVQAHRQVEISVINPRRARPFAESLGERSKTDPVDARVLCEYAARMLWVPWQPPSPVGLCQHCFRSDEWFPPESELRSLGLVPATTPDCSSGFRAQSRPELLPANSMLRKRARSLCRRRGLLVMR
jgi:Transposase